jgi:hypothetical protein
MTRAVWWVRQVIMIVFGVILLLFGIQLLTAAYRLSNPHWFIMTFFASNLIILISGALLAGFVAQLLKMRKESNRPSEDKEVQRGEGGPGVSSHDR